MQALSKRFKVSNDLNVLLVHLFLHAITYGVLSFLIRIVNLVNQVVLPQVPKVTVEPLHAVNGTTHLKSDPIDHLLD
jgi:hypothetical protein